MCKLKKHFYFSDLSQDATDNAINKKRHNEDKLRSQDASHTSTISHDNDPKSTQDVSHTSTSSNDNDPKGTQDVSHTSTSSHGNDPKGTQDVSQTSTISQGNDPKRTPGEDVLHNHDIKLKNTGSLTENPITSFNVVLGQTNTDSSVSLPDNGYTVMKSELDLLPKAPSPCYEKITAPKQAPILLCESLPVSCERFVYIPTAQVHLQLLQYMDSAKLLPQLIQPGVSQPEISQMGVSQPEISLTGASQLGIMQSGVSQSGVSQPGVSQPGVTQTGVSQPGVSQPGVSQPGVRQSVIIKTRSSQPGVNQPGISQSGVNQPEVSQLGVSQRAVSQLGASQPGTSPPGASQPGVSKAGVNQSGASQPGVSQPGVNQPGASQPGVSHPGVSQTGIIQPGVLQPELEFSRSGIISAIDAEDIYALWDRIPQNRKVLDAINRHGSEGWERLCEVLRTDEEQAWMADVLTRDMMARRTAPMTLHRSHSDRLVHKSEVATWNRNQRPTCSAMGALPRDRRVRSNKGGLSLVTKTGSTKGKRIHSTTVAPPLERRFSYEEQVRCAAHRGRAVTLDKNDISNHRQPRDGAVIRAQGLSIPKRHANKSPQPKQIALRTKSTKEQMRHVGNKYKNSEHPSTSINDTLDENFTPDISHMPITLKSNHAAASKGKESDHCKDNALPDKMTIPQHKTRREGKSKVKLPQMEMNSMGLDRPQKSIKVTKSKKRFFCIVGTPSESSSPSSSTTSLHKDWYMTI